MDALLVDEMDLGVLEMQMVEFLLKLAKVLVVFAVGLGHGGGGGSDRKSTRLNSSHWE